MEKTTKRDRENRLIVTRKQWIKQKNTHHCLNFFHATNNKPLGIIFYGWGGGEFCGG